MTKKLKIKDIAIETIKDEANAINNLINFIDDDFISAVECISYSKGRIVISGIGKSAIIAQKIVATLNSTGTASIFMHTSDAIHGDLGIIQKNDTVIFISKSGESDDIKTLLPLIKNNGNKIISIISNKNSYLAINSDYIIKAFVKKEICLNDIVPTSSTTAQLVLGDAIAASLLHIKGFSVNDFAKIHPGGTLGKKLYLKVDDIFSKHEVPKVKIDDNLKNIILEISSKRLGATAVIDNENNLLGIITDGDLRRMLQKNNKIDLICAKDILSKNPKTINKESLAIDAFYLMKKNNITQLAVTEDNKYLGIIHIHDILKEGII